MITVTIIVEGGVVQKIDLPNGVVVIVKDYDVDGFDEDRLQTDSNGDEYAESRWEG